MEVHKRKTGYCFALLLVVALLAVPYAHARHGGAYYYLHGLVSDKVTGKPVPSAEVGLLYARGNTTIMTFSTKTDTKGYYGIWLNGGQLVTLAVSKDGYQETEASVYVKVGVSNVRLDIEITPTGSESLAVAKA